MIDVIEVNLIDRGVAESIAMCGSCLRSARSTPNSRSASVRATSARRGAARYEVLLCATCCRSAKAAIDAAISQMRKRIG